MTIVFTVDVVDTQLALSFATCPDHSPFFEAIRQSLLAIAALRLAAVKLIVIVFL